MSATAPSTSISEPLPFSIQQELKNLRYEKKNHDLHRLPTNTTVRRRPINHAPIADIHAGAHVPKCVYVSRRTPVMAAVKRVKKILREIERRVVRGAMGGRVAGGKRGDNGVGMAQGIAKANEALRKEREEVLVKASGRAMEQALRIGEWFRSKEKEVLCDVVVRTSSVNVVDDIVEIEKENEILEDGEGQTSILDESKMIECGDTTLELLGDTTTSTVPQDSSNERGDGTAGPDREHEDGAMDEGDTPAVKKTRKRKRKKRPMYEEDDVPEARLRWVKTVEVAISLKA